MPQQALDKVGRVLKIYSDGDVRVAIADHAWTFNPAVLVKEASAATPTDQQPQQSTLQRGELQGILQPSSSSTSSSAQGQEHPFSTAEERGQSERSQREIGRTLLIHVVPQITEFEVCTDGYGPLVRGRSRKFRKRGPSSPTLPSPPPNENFTST